MTGPVAPAANEPLEMETYRHHLLLLKSLHCSRPVLYQGKYQFLKALTLNDSGGSIGMVVYLAGKQGGIDSAEIQIKSQPSN